MQLNISCISFLAEMSNFAELHTYSNILYSDILLLNEHHIVYSSNLLLIGRDLPKPLICLQYKTHMSYVIPLDAT
jgi:hypothetical protein